MIVCCLYIYCYRVVVAMPSHAMSYFYSTHSHHFLIVFTLKHRIFVDFIIIGFGFTTTHTHNLFLFALTLGKECVCLFALSTFICFTIHNIYMWMEFKLVMLCVCYVMSLSRSISISRNFYYLLRHHYCFIFIESFKCSFDELTACLALPLTHHPHKWVNEFDFFFLI